MQRVSKDLVRRDDGTTVGGKLPMVSAPKSGSARNPTLNTTYNVLCSINSSFRRSVYPRNDCDLTDVGVGILSFAEKSVVHRTQTKLEHQVAHYLRTTRICKGVATAPTRECAAIV